MSWHHVRAVFDIEGIPPTRKLVLLALARRAGDEGRAWPSIPRLCRDTGLSDRAVRYALKALAETELLTVHRAPGRGLSMHLGAALGAVENHPGPAPGAGPPRHDMPRPRHLSAKTAAPGADRSNKEDELKYGGPRDGETWGEYRERGGR
jgi:Helix-turn-helix domain